MEWISIKNRTPTLQELKNPILVYCSEGIHVARFPLEEDRYGIVGGWESCNYCGGESRVVFSNPRYAESVITHWMPLPVEPK